MSAVLVTGAGGFVGNHVARQLHGAGHRVTALLGPDDCTAPQVERVVQGDILDAARLSDALAGVEHVVHAAGPPSVAASFADPVVFARTHVAGTAAVFHAAAGEGVRSAMLVSSAEVYGRNPAEAVDEDEPSAPVSPYGAAKLGAEWMARSICAAAGVPLTILRPFSLYGPGMRRDSVVGTILDQLRQDGDIALFDLAPVRDYLHIDDFVTLVHAALERPAPLRILNACSGEGVAVGDVAHAALGAAGASRTVRQRAGGDRPADVNRLVGSRRAAGTALGWAPEVTLAQGLEAMLRG